MQNKDKIIIIDFGSQYTQLIARKVREVGVFSEILPYDCDTKDIANSSAKGIILSGGPQNVNQEDAATINDIVFRLGIPILGICYGMQAISKQSGGQVIISDKQEFGHSNLQIIAKNPLFKDIKNETLAVWMSHGDKVESVSDDFVITAKTSSCPIAAIAHKTKPIFGIQFHPEVTHTQQGTQILSNFVENICNCKAVWNSSNIAKDIISSLRQEIGDEKVILGLSGGVDSSVVAMLLHKAIGNQLTCVFVDNGLLRLNEGDKVMAMFADNFGVNVIRVNAENDFLNALANTSDPEEKRKKIGKVFIDIFEAQSKQITNVKYLAQGTIYPDIIESAGAKSGKAHTIKSHHNVGGLPKKMKLKLVEPLRELFKDEVRKLGLELGIPHNMLYRHPFPGPGLGVRILGQVTKEYADILRKADDIFISELEKHNLYDKTSQAFAVFLPVKSVGVTGDGRRYDFVIALRAVETIDFMTARWAELPYDFLGLVSNRIMNEITRVSRVVYDISGKPPATIEWE